MMIRYTEPLFAKIMLQNIKDGYYTVLSYLCCVKRNQNAKMKASVSEIEDEWETIEF